MRHLIITLSLIALLAGCTPGGAKGKLVKATQQVDQHADDIVENANAATDAYKAGGDPVPMHKAIKESAKKIKVETREARQQATDTENKTSPTLNLATLGLKVAGMAILITGVVILCWKFGVFPLVRRLMGQFTALIPAPTRRRAEFDAAMVESGTAPPEQREKVAAERTADPAYEAAYLAKKTRIRAAKGSPPSGAPSAPAGSSG